MLLSKQNTSLALCAASNAYDYRDYRLDYLRVDRAKNTLTAASVGALYVSALPDQDTEDEFPKFTHLKPTPVQPILNQFYIPAIALQAAADHMPRRPPAKKDRMYPDELYPILEHVRVTQTVGLRPDYLLETNDLVTQTMTPVKAINEYKEAPDLVTWPNIEKLSQAAEFDLHTQTPDTAIPEVILSVSDLKTLVKIHKAHNVEHVRIAVSTYRPNGVPVIFTDVGNTKSMTKIIPAVTSYLMPLWLVNPPPPPASAPQNPITNP